MDVAEWKMLPVLKMISPFPFDVGIGKILELMWCPTFWGYTAYCPFFGSILSKSVKVYEHGVVSNFNWESENERLILVNLMMKCCVYSSRFPIVLYSVYWTKIELEFGWVLPSSIKTINQCKTSLF